MTSASNTTHIRGATGRRCGEGRAAQVPEASSSGAVVGGLGVATLLFVTLPARSLYLRSMEQAEDARWVTDLDRPLERARTREQVMWVSAAIGGGAAVLGTAVMTAGLVRRHRMLQTPASTFSMAPAVGGGQLGMTASVRF